VSDRTWGRLFGELWFEDWDTCPAVILAMLISLCPNAFGIYKLPYGFIKKRLADTWDCDAIMEAIDFLQEDGTIKLYRNNTVVWIPKKCQRDGTTSPKNWRHVKNLKDILSAFNEVSEDFLRRYNAYSMAIESTDTDADSDTDADTEDKNTSKRRTIKYYKTEMADDELPELEQQCGWQGAWLEWKKATAAAQGGKRTVAALASDLRDLIAKQRKYGLDNAAMAYGIDQAISRDKYNRNYVIACAKGYNPTAGMSEQAYYGIPQPEPLPPVQPGPDDIVIGD